MCSPSLTYALLTDIQSAPSLNTLVGTRRMYQERAGAGHAREERTNDSHLPAVSIYCTRETGRPPANQTKPQSSLSTVPSQTPLKNRTILATASPSTGLTLSKALETALTLSEHHVNLRLGLSVSYFAAKNSTNLIGGFTAGSAFEDLRRWIHSLGGRSSKARPEARR